MEGGNTGAGHGKRTTFRRMNQMNEDFLPLLKKPLCSELSRQVVGHNAGQRAQCQRRLDLWFKERNIVLEKMRRSQDQVYGIFLRRHKEKKMQQKSMYRREQDLIRQQQQELDQQQAIEQAIADAKEESTMGKPQPVTASKSTKATTDQNNHSHTPSLPKVHTKNTTQTQPSVTSKVLEVRKDKPFSPATKERSFTSDPTQFEPPGDVPPDMQAFANIEDVLLVKRAGGTLDDDYQNGDKTKNTRKKSNTTESSKRKSDSKESESKNRRMGVVNPPQICTLDNVQETPTGKTRRQTNSLTRAPMMETITEDSPGAVPRVSPDKPTSTRSLQPREQTPLVLPPIYPSSEGDEDTDHEDIFREIVEDGTKPPTLSQLNRLRAKEQEKRRAELLEKEACPVYVRDQNNYFVISDAPFRRRKFQAPSQREKYFQAKMLESQQSAQTTHKDRMDDFFDKLEAEERAKERQRDSQRAAVAAQEEREHHAAAMAASRNIGVTLQALVAAFQRDKLPPGLDKDSVLAIKLYCRYVRAYSPRTAEQKAEDERLKKSSWDR